MRSFFAVVLIGTALSAPVAAAAQTPIQPGARVRGSLASGDAQLSGGEFMDTYSLNGRAGQQLVIRLTSSAFDPYLLMRGPSDFNQDNDDEATGSTAARLEVRLPADGTYRIVVTSYRSGESGSYELEVQEAGTGVAVAPAGPSAPSGGGAISMGQTLRGELAQGDETLRSGEFSDTYRFQGRRGQTVTLRLASTAFDSYLLVRGPGNYTEDNDDDATERGSHNSRLDLTLPADGEYRVLATSYRPGEAGAYTLAMSGTGAAAAPAQVASAAPQSRGQLVLGQAMRGRLEQGDPQLRSGEFVDAYAFQGTRGQRLDIRLSSSEFDPYVQINGPGNFQEYNDDDVDGGTSNSHLVVTLPADGQYQVMATSYRPGESGNYVLAAEATNAISAGSGSAVAAAAVTLGQSVTGSLEGSDDTLTSGERVDRYRFDGRTGQRLAIDMTSTTLDSYIQLVAPSGRIEENDDARSGVNDARLETVLTENGTYVVLATSFSRGMTGTYRLSVASLDEARTTTTATAPGAPPAAAASGTALAMGAPVNGRLQTGDGTLSSGEFRDSYVFQGRRGQVVTVDMTSTEMDPYLMVVAPGGQQQENDDVSGTDRNARVTWVLPADGSFNVLATTYRPGETGSYTLRVSTGAAAAAAVAARPAPGAARPAPGAAPAAAPGARPQRVYAVLVGISDYGGQASDLPFTAEDATKMAQTLQRAGVLADASIVITDAQATYERVRSAFQQVAQAAGPDDLFLFFYSGHGTQTNSQQSATEPDGRSEAIVLRDRLVSDEEMGQWFSTVRSRLGLIALDACFSGGFARNVVNHPGVMGLFSSEEDLTSAVAGKFQAGGYLSHFLRTGLAGDADGDSDRSITAGELSAYLRRQFATQAANVEAVTSDRQRNYQYLVVERGGVKIDDLVLTIAAR